MPLIELPRAISQSNTVDEENDATYIALIAPTDIALLSKFVTLNSLYLCYSIFLSVTCFGMSIGILLCFSSIVILVGRLSFCV